MDSIITAIFLALMSTTGLQIATADVYLDTESQALLDFKRGAQGIMGGHLSSWTGNVCTTQNWTSWTGITCKGSRVLNITVDDSFGGSLPSSWANLTGLQNLDLSGSHLIGSLPSSWSKLTGLQTLYLYQNNLNGSLPTSWASLTGLQSLDLSHNSLTGSLPSSWANLTGLRTLHLHQNKLTGSMPSTWANMTGLQNLSLCQNKLTGSLPSNWANMRSLQTLYLYQNNLTGSLPTSWASLTGLQIINLSGSHLTGSLPSSWANLTGLQSLDLSGSYLTGSLPSSWSKLTGLRTLYLFQNNLTGSLPSTWANMTGLQNLSLCQNNLNGSLPTSWAKLAGLHFLALHQNNLTGPLPSEWSSMWLGSLYLQNNSLTGTLPELWKNLDFKVLDLSSNSLTGSLPAAWVGISVLSKDIQVLDLSQNCLSGSIPTFIGGQFAQSSSHYGQAAPMVLAPMTPNHGLCGSIPANANVTTADGHPLLGQMDLRTCPVAAAASTVLPHRKAAVIGSVVSLCAMVVAAATILLLRRGIKSESGFGLYVKLWRAPVSRGSIKQSLTSHKSQSMADLKFETKTGKRVELGRGSFGVVYKGKWGGLAVAVKVLTSRDLVQQAQFREETKLLESLRHPHVVNYLGHVFKENEEMMLVTEFMPGNDLGTCIRNDISMPRLTGWYCRGQSILLGIARGLVYLHSQHIVWFDCKPGNVLLDHTGLVAKISDVGLSKMLATSQTETVLRGTRGYMAPELFYGYVEEDRTPVTKAVDVYSFGVLICEVVTGQKLVLGQGLRQPRVPEECPQGVIDLYLSCLQKDPMLRPSAETLMKSIEKLTAASAPAT